MSDNSNFRPSVLERLSTPDQLDQLIRVISPGSWMFLLGLILVLIIFILWGIFGTVSVKVNGEGIVLEGSIHDVVSEFQGEVAQLYVKSGDTVAIGDLLVEIELANVSGQSVERTSPVAGDSVGDGGEPIQIRATHSGRIARVAVESGETVSPDVSMMEIETVPSRSDRLKVILYVSLNQGKKIEVGMPVEIAPATVAPEEYGYIKGTITHVSDLPSSTRSMQEKLKSDQLVAQFSALGAPFEIEATLTPDSASPSGYAWTSGKGPNIKITNSTPVVARILIGTKHPVENVIPGFKKILAF